MSTSRSKATATVEATLRRFLDGDPADASWVRLRRILIPAVASTIVADLSQTGRESGGGGVSG